MTGIPDGPELLGGLKPAAVTTMATPVMGVLVTPGEPAVGPPGHEPTASAAAWTEAYPMFGKSMDAPGWFEYVLQWLTLMLVILGVGAEEVRGCKSNLAALWKMVLEHDERDTL